MAEFSSATTHTNNTDAYVKDMARGFTSFIDDVLRGRENKTVLNGSVAAASLHIGLPTQATPPADISAQLINNRDFFNPSNWGSENHPLFDLSEENFTLFGLDFGDMFEHLKAGLDGKGFESDHSSPLYENTIAEALNLPDLPYGGLAHFAHMGVALYDTGRTFQDLWNEPSLKHNIIKIMTHPEMAETLAHRATMLTVMGVLHPLGPVIAIGVAYLAAHLVHSAFDVLNHNKDAMQHLQDVPVISAIYNASGIKEWAETPDRTTEDAGSIADLESPDTHIAQHEHADRLALRINRPER